jgi:chemotaxis signal transduction protein
MKQHKEFNEKKEILMEQTHNFLFITFVLNRRQRDLDVRCCGCKDIMVSDYKKPTYIKGMIEFEGQIIPVVDPSTWFGGQPTRVTASACILVVQHSYECRPLKTGVLVPDTEEVMNLAAGNYASGTPKETSFNTRFVLDILRNIFSNRFLADSHLALSRCERRKRMDDDFKAFREIVSRGRVHA